MPVRDKVRLTKLRELALDAPSRPGRPRYLSAASGLVVVKSFHYVVADDELHLGVFPADGATPGTLFRLFEGELPKDKSDRKREKPDLETLLLLPSFARYEHGALLAIGSGSKSNRRRGALLALDERGGIRGQSRVIDLADLMSPIKKHVGDLNIEGAVTIGDALILLQRGNRGGGVNALVTMHLPDFLAALAAGDSVPAQPFDVRIYDLGSIDDVPLCFTDGAALPDGRVVFSAVAEDTSDSYSDGPCSGAAIGILSADGHVQSVRRITPGAKVEGVAVHLEGGRINLLLVTDADDVSVPASLYAAELE
jgi:hypothetical protein